MASVSPGPLVNYSVYEASECDEMARLLADAFAHRDPPAAAMGLTPGEFEKFARLFCSKAASEGLTIVARSSETAEMVGVLLAKDSAGAMPEGMDTLSPKFDPIFDIIGELDFPDQDNSALRPGESLHLLLLGVAERFAGHGIAQQLVAECMANGCRKGYRVAICEATNTTSQYVFRKLGFVERARGSYQDHRFNGCQFSTSIAEHGGPMLMDKPLSA